MVSGCAFETGGGVHVRGHHMEGAAVLGSRVYNAQQKAQCPYGTVREYRRAKNTTLPPYWDGRGWVYPGNHTEMKGEFTCRYKTVPVTPRTPHRSP